MITADSLNVSGYDFIEQGEHGSVTPDVIDVDECGGAEKRPHGADSNFVRLTVIVSELVSCRNQSTQRAAPLCAAIRRTD